MEREILLVQRRKEPFKDYWAIPGGFVEITEDTKTTCLRELKEETGISGEIVELIGVYDAPDRDPRHTVNISYLVRTVGKMKVEARDDVKDAQWFPLDDLPPLAFGHGEQIKNAIKLLDR